MLSDSKEAALPNACGILGGVTVWAMVQVYTCVDRKMKNNCLDGFELLIIRLLKKLFILHCTFDYRHVLDNNSPLASSTQQSIWLL